MRRRTVLAGLGSTLAATAGASAAATPAPVGQTGRWEQVRDWTFGLRPGATVKDMRALSEEFRFRYIYDNGRLDGLDTYWSKHRDYPQGDPRSLHVFTDQGLVLKGRLATNGGLWPGGIESGMLRALLPVKPGMLVEMRARLPRGLGVWPAFWLNPGVEVDGHFSATPWPPEIDIFEFFVWQGRTRPRILTASVQTAGRPADFGNPEDTFSLFTHGGYDPGIDFSEDFHVFALDWQDDLPTWLLDGKMIKQTRYRWNAPPAHILVTNQIGMVLHGVDLSGMQARESDWDYVVDWLRVWRRA